MICTLCPRRCGAERTAEAGGGFCRMPAGLRVARAMLHRWEEPPISGRNGAGTVFFSGCTLGCVYCQNGDISAGGFGKDISTARLPVPVVYNCGGYERVETLRTLEGLVDVYLPDLKYADGTLAAALSGAADYFPVACQAIREMFRQVGPYVLEDGLLKRGVVIRHLVLPGYLDNTRQVLDWIAETFAPGDVLVSLMSQYTPTNNMTGRLARRVTAAEYRAAAAYMRNCGITDGFVQERTSAEEAYTPAFDGQGV